MVLDVPHARGDPFLVEGESTSVTADTVIISTGASANWLDLPSVNTFRNKGISACATCFLISSGVYVASPSERRRPLMAWKCGP